MKLQSVTHERKPTMKRFICIVAIIMITVLTCIAETSIHYLQGDTFSQQIAELKDKLAEEELFDNLTWNTRKIQAPCTFILQYAENYWDIQDKNGVYDEILYQTFIDLKNQGKISFIPDKDNTIQEVEDSLKLDELDSIIQEDNAPKYYVLFSFECEDEDLHLVGHEWCFEYTTRKEDKIVNSHQVPMNPGDTIKILYCLAEVDSYPAYNFGTISFPVPDKIQDYFVLSPFDVQIVENRGQYSGCNVTWSVQIAFVAEGCEIDHETIFQCDTTTPIIHDVQKNILNKETVLAVAPTGDGTYIGNKNSKAFHYPTCASVTDMKEKNKVPLSSREEAIESGFHPCSRCKP